MGIITKILEDYDKLVKTQIVIPLNTGDTIRFTFNIQDLPHLLGLHYLVDIPVLFEYKQGRISATDLYKAMKKGTLDTESFEKSKYFQQIYTNRIQHFSSEMVMQIIKSKQLVKFNPERIKVFSSKLEKVDYMFWKQIQDRNGNYVYFGIGFTTSLERDMNFPNTFFLRADTQYIHGQIIVDPLSIWIKKKRQMKFEIYWDNIRKCMKKNTHYKALMKQGISFGHDTETASEDRICDLRDEDLRRHYKLLRLDEMDKAYLPYMSPQFKWNNQEKAYLIEQKEALIRNYLPNEILMLLNEYRIKI